MEATISGLVNGLIRAVMLSVVTGARRLVVMVGKWDLTSKDGVRPKDGVRQAAAGPPGLATLPGSLPSAAAWSLAWSLATPPELVSGANHRRHESC